MKDVSYKPLVTTQYKMKSINVNSSKATAPLCLLLEAGMIVHKQVNKSILQKHKGRYRTQNSLRLSCGRS